MTVFYQVCIKKGINYMSNIQDKVVIISGASSGIGEATAKELASKGGKLVLAAVKKD
jgi:NADP-dependent 3-hydroxy acid dehydrogenase YdfG